MRSPFSRLVAVGGLVVLGIIAYQLATGAVKVEDAALRSMVTLVAVVSVHRLGRLGLGVAAGNLDTPDDADPPASDPLVSDRMGDPTAR